jgi:putative membrane protein
MGPGMMGDYGWGMGWFGSIFMVLFWGAVIVALVLAIRWLWVSSAGAHKSESKDSALEILRQRYARGEIGKEEFEEKKRDLE